MPSQTACPCPNPSGMLCRIMCGQTTQDRATVRTADAAISPVERLHALVAADMTATDKLIHTRMKK